MEVRLIPAHCDVVQESMKKAGKKGVTEEATASIAELGQLSPPS